MFKNLIGLGSPNSRVNFYIANRPAIDDYPSLSELRSVAAGELAHIVTHTSNHWRKAFNVYAKVLFEWHKLIRSDIPATWQTYRDAELFQHHSDEALLFSPPKFDKSEATIHIIAGKTYAAHLKLPPLDWLDAYFAVNEEHRLIVAPYPDYRQLSNARIERLIELMQTFTR